MKGRGSFGDSRRVCTNKRSRALRHDESAIVEFGKLRPRDELMQCVSS